MEVCNGPTLQRVLDKRGALSEPETKDIMRQLVDAIVRAEAGGGWWTLMHRFNLASALLEEKCSPANERNRVAAYHAASKAYVWLRYSASRKLTWQRNYNVKPRELSAAQSKLTRVVAGLYCAAPHLRDTARLMLGTVGKGGGGGENRGKDGELHLCCYCCG